MILIPEVEIVNTCNTVLDIIRDQHNQSMDDGNEDRSLLYLLFNGKSIGKYDFYANAKELLITTDSDANHLEVRLGFDNSPAKRRTTIFISTSSESTINNSIGIGQGDQDELVFENDEPIQDQYIKQYARRYQTTNQIVFVSDNRNAMAIMYTLFKAMITSCIEHLAMSGLENLKIGGQDLRMDIAAPDKVLMKAITLTYEYTQVTPSVFIQDIFTKICVTGQIATDDSD